MIIICYRSLDQGAYSTNDKIGLMVKIDNHSAVDVAGSTIRVLCNQYIIVIHCCMVICGKLFF